MSIAIRPFCWTESLRWLDWYAVGLGSNAWKTPGGMSRKTLSAIRTSASVKPSWLRSRLGRLHAGRGPDRDERFPAHSPRGLPGLRAEQHRVPVEPAQA